MWLTRRDMVIHEDNRAKVEVAFVANKMWKARLRWFGHVKRRCINALNEDV